MHKFFGASRELIKVSAFSKWWKSTLCKVAVDIHLEILTAQLDRWMQGRTVDFKNTLIIMTSNVGSSVIEKGGGGLGFQLDVNEEDSSYNRIKTLVNEELKQYFRCALDDTSAAAFPSFRGMHASEAVLLCYAFPNLQPCLSSYTDSRNNCQILFVLQCLVLAAITLVVTVLQAGIPESAG